MKKLTALMAALALAVCTFTACENSNKNSSSTPPASSSETATEPDTLSADSDGAKLCTDLLNEYLDSINTGDIEKSFKYQYFDEIIEAVAALSGYESVEAMYDNFKGSFDGMNLVINSIESVQPITDYQYGFIEEIYGRFCAVQYIIDRDGGINKTTTKYLQEVYGDEEKYKEYKLDFKEGYYMECTLTSEGQGNVAQRIMFYRTEDDNWKLDMTVAGYIDECEDYAIDHIADEIVATANDLLDKNTKIDGKQFIVGSDKGLDVNVPKDFDADELRKFVTENCEAYTGGKFFIFVKENHAYYAAYAENDDYTGTSPYGAKIGEKEGTADYVEIDLEDHNLFENIYNSSAEAVKKYS